MGIYLGATELSTGGGGGGGITKFKKYSTLRSLDDTDVKTTDNPIGGIVMTSNTTANNNQTTTTLNLSLATPAGALIGQQGFFDNYYTRTITGNTATTGANQNSTVTWNAVTAGLNTNPYVINPPTSTGITGYYVNASTITVNPATDLLLADGATIGVLLVGGGGKGAGALNINTEGQGRGGYGGRLLYKVTTITNAATNLVLQIGGGGSFTSNVPSTPSISTITGGLSLTSADGNNISGYPATWNMRYNSGNYNESLSSAGPGNYGGYGVGGRLNFFTGFNGGNGQHGWGTGGTAVSVVGGDGAILLYY
tara:strand:- start:32 stop:961 length:930 start_codon:yes stop_codon:yes gene_type:complete